MDHNIRKVKRGEPQKGLLSNYFFESPFASSSVAISCFLEDRRDLRRAKSAGLGMANPNTAVFDDAGQSVDARPVGCDGMQQCASRGLGRVWHGVAAAEYLAANVGAGHGGVYCAGVALVAVEQGADQWASGLGERERREGVGEVQ